MDKKSVEEFKKRLLKMRSEILSKAKRLKEDSYNLGTDGIQDMADAASNTYNADILMAISDNDLSVLKDVDNALDKISHGTYGICEECEEKVSEKRLEVNPAARYCINCKRAMEAQGK